MPVTHDYKTRRPTIVDVARLCGLSKATVSKALNMAPDVCPLQPKTREHVIAVAKQIGYRPSWRGRALAQRKTHTIGILYTPPMPIVVSGIYEPLVESVSRALQANGYYLLFVPLGPDPDAWAPLLMDQRLDGCIVLDHLSPGLFEVLSLANMPAVLLNEKSTLPLSQVLVDDRQGASEITDYLLALGHRRISFFLGPFGDFRSVEHYSIPEREQGYRAAMDRAGVGDYAEVNSSSPDELVARIQSASNPPTAIIAYAHFFAIDLIQSLWRAGLRVPDDISVVAFNDVYPVANVVPPLTTVSLPTDAMGQLAAEMILEQVETDRKVTPRSAVLPESLAIRQSSAPPRRSS